MNHIDSDFKSTFFIQKPNYSITHLHDQAIYPKRGVGRYSFNLTVIILICPDYYNPNPCFGARVNHWHAGKKTIIQRANPIKTEPNPAIKPITRKGIRVLPVSIPLHKH